MRALTFLLSTSMPLKAVHQTRLLGRIIEWHVELPFFLILGRLSSYAVSPL